MKANQKYSPKYWVVNDTKGDDVFINTARKSKIGSIEVFMNENAYNVTGRVFSDEDLYHWWEEQTQYKCELIEIQLTGIG